MTEAEFLENTFVCTRLPGGYARLSYETCVARQEKKETGGRWGDESRVIFYACLDCEQGRENKKIWEDTMGSGRGTCGCCGRQNMAYANRFAGVYVCGFCIKHLKDAEKHGVAFEQAKAEIRAEALNMKPGTRPKVWSWSDLPVPGSEKQPEKPAVKYNPCQCSECVYFDQEFDGHCTKYGDDASESCETYSSIPSALTKPVDFEDEAPPAPLHDMGYPAPSERDKELIAARLKAQRELHKGMPLLLSSDNRSVPPTPDETRYLVIDLQSEAELAEWLRRKAKVNRRSYLVDQVLAILDSHMAADREMDGRAA